MKRIVAASLMTVFAFAIVGCSGDGGGGGGLLGTDNSKELKQLGMAYHEYFAQFNKGPANADELARTVQNPKAIDAVRSGDVVFIWNVHLLQGMTAGTSITILAYEKQVPEKGGHVLFGDGAVQKLSADEFGKAPKATPKQ